MTRRLKLLPLHGQHNLLCLVCPPQYVGHWLQLTAKPLPTSGQHMHCHHQALYMKYTVSMPTGGRTTGLAIQECICTLCLPKLCEQKIQMTLSVWMSTCGSVACDVYA